MDAKTMENSCSSNPFERLPNDVVIYIMKKLSNDLKFLTQCSLVSHLFASAILHVPHVLLTLPSLPYPFISNYGAYDVLHGLRSELKSTYDKATILLTKFLNLRSLHVVFSEHDYDTNENDGLLVEGFMSHLKMKSKRRVMEKIKKPNFVIPLVLSYWYGDPCDNASTFESLSRLNVWTEVYLWRDLLLLAITDFPMLQTVAISNPKLTVCISGEELLEFKKVKNGRESMMRMRRYLQNKKQAFV